MQLSPTDLIALSRLLDEAMDLEPEQVDGWLAGLSAEHEHLRARLQEMLAEHRRSSNPAFMLDGPKLADAPDETVARTGDLVGPYRLIREIGRGGMGAVWLAERADGTLKRQIALKLPRLAWGAGLAERMARERDIGALLEHPNIARLYDAGVDAKGRPYLALEYIDGQPLDVWCEAQALSIRDRLRLFVQVAKAVAYAHGRLVVHRDLKPSNVLVTSDGQAHLLDFGIAKLLHEAGPSDDQLTQEQGRVLTPHYASPEQIEGETITVASDVYSLGVLLYELLTGRFPNEWRSKSLAAIEEAILKDEPALASSRSQDKTAAKTLRGEIDAILAKALRREPGQRYATADGFAEDIERHLNGERVIARPDSVGYRLSKSIRRHRIGLAAIGAVLLAVLGGAAVAMVQAKRASDSAERARVVKEFVVDLFKVNERGTPGNAELRQLPAELLLQRGAKLIETRFPGQPALQAELLGVVSGIFADMGANALAVDYATRQIESLVAIGAGDAEQAKATLVLAQALLAEGRLADGEIRVRRAVALSEPYDGLRQEALVLMARVLRRQGKQEEAARMLDRAERELSAHAQRGPTTTSALAKLLRATLMYDQNRLDLALPIYQAAIDEALAAEGGLSLAAVAIRLNLAHNLLIADRADEARPYRDAALAALRAAGGAGDIRAALNESKSAKTMFMMHAIPFAEAKATIERDKAEVAARGALVPDAIKASIDFDLGNVHLLWGDIKSADPLIASSASTLRPRTEAPGERFDLAVYQGLAAMYAGRHQEADTYLRERLALRNLMGGGRSPFATYDYVYIAQNLCMQGQCTQARAFLDSAPAFDDLKGRPSNSGSYSLVIRRALARIDLELGDSASARELLPGEDGNGNDTLLLRGEILCAQGYRSDGLALLETYLQDEQRIAYEHAPDLARARAVAGQCALANGQRKRATELADLARASFAAQPNVSPYFKRALEQLDRRLGTRSVER